MRAFTPLRNLSGRDGSFCLSDYIVLYSPFIAGEAVQAEITGESSVCGGSGDFRLESQSSQGRTTRRWPRSGKAEGR